LLLSYALTPTLSQRERAFTYKILVTPGLLSYIDNQIGIENKSGLLFAANNMKALVVDDDDLIRSNVAEVLSNEGWEVSEAASAEQALELLHRDTWSLVFCDVRLSAKNNHEGYDVLRSFTEEQPEAQIVLMTT